MPKRMHKIKYIVSKTGGNLQKGDSFVNVLNNKLTMTNTFVRVFINLC